MSRMASLSYLSLIVLYLSTTVGLLVTDTSNHAIKRLSGNVIPSRYRLDIATYLTGNFSFHGEVWIEITVKNPTDEILLHSKDLQILNVKLERTSINDEPMKIYFIDKRIVSNILNMTNNKNSSKITFPGRIRVDNEEITDETTYEDPVNITSLPTNEDMNTNTTDGNEEAYLSLLYDIFQQPTVSTSPLTLKKKARYLTKVSATFSVAPLPVKSTNATLESGRQNSTIDKSNANTAQTNGTNQRIDTTLNEKRNKTTNDNVLKSIHISDIIIQKENGMVLLKLSEKLERKWKYRLHLKYVGKLSDDHTGYYKLPYKDRTKNETRWMATTVFETIEARRAFPCFDEPGYKAVFQVNLARPKGMRTLSNMDISKTQLMIGRPGWEVDSFYESPPMSTYLVAFFVGQHEARETKTTNGHSIRIWTRAGVLEGQANYALDAAPKFEEYFVKYFDVKNPLNKTDLLALPSFVSDALENWGLISFDEKYILHEPRVSTQNSKQAVATVLAHELAHTWFGNLVTMDWWSNIWLNEGFAVYFATNAVNAVYPEWEFESTQAVKAFLRVYSIDALRTSHPLIQKVENTGDLTNLFDTITYYKGYYLLRMVHSTLGDNTFRKGIRNYLKHSVFGSVGKNDIWRHLGQQAHDDGTLALDKDLGDIMGNWTNLAGYPVVSVLRDYDTGSIDLLQNRFLRSQDDVEARVKPDVLDYSWWIPLTYTSEEELLFNETTARFWLDPMELVSTIDDFMPKENHWILFNIKASGLYRVNYDTQNWELLSKYLASENYYLIDVLNRAQLVDDVLDLARAGDVPYPLALRLASYMTRETHYLPWLATFSNMDYIQRMLQTTNATEVFQRFVRFLVTPLFDKLGFGSREDQSVLDTLNRQQIVRWACQTGVPTCVQQAVELYREWMDIAKSDNSSNPIASNLRPAVYCTAIANGGEEEWAFLWLKYLTTTVASERTAALTGLGCTKKIHILKKYLELSIQGNSGIRKQDSLSVFKAVAKNELGLSLATEFLQGNVTHIKDFVGESRMQLPLYLDALATMMNTEEQLRQMEEMQIANMGAFRTNSQPVQMTNEKLKFNIEWIKGNYDAISSWLNDRE